MSDTEDQSYSLDELAEKTGFDKRVIRSFIEQGLLPGPDSMGRYARYSHWHLVKLLAIKELKSQNARLSEVRQMLNTQSPSFIHELAQQQVSQTGEPGNSGEDESKNMSSALDYIRSITGQSQPAAPPAPQTPPSTPKFAKFSFGSSNKVPTSPPPATAWNSTSASTTGGAGPTIGNAAKTPVDFLLDELSRLLGKPRVRRQAKSEAWYRISITPDVELSVRGIQNPEQLAQLEQVADYLREIFLRGGYK